MNNSLQVFSYESHSIRTVEHNGDIWFVAKDVCNVLGIQNIRQNTVTLDDDEKGVCKIDTPGGAQEMTIINESGLYTLILRSNKPNAKDFRKWVTGTVLPSIRKHGAYMTPAAIDKIITDPDFGIRLLQELKNEQQKARELEAKIQQDKPKVIFADSVSASDSSILIGQLAKLLKQNGINIGPHRLFEWLREHGYLMKQASSYNMPTQKSMELGIMSIIERTVNKGDGDPFVVTTTQITGKGQIYFINLFRKYQEAQS